MAAAVTACKQALADGVDSVLKEQLHSVFSRSGFTSGYYNGAADHTMFGFRQKEDVVSAAPVLKQLSRLYDKETPLIPCDFALSIVAGETISLAAVAGGCSVFVEENVVPEAALHKPLTAEALKERISKCGGTPFYANRVDVDLDEGLIVPASALNALRRKALDQLLELKSTRHPLPLQPPPQDLTDCLTAAKSFGRPYFTARFADAAQIPAELSALHEVYLPLETPFAALKALARRHPRVGVELPRGMFGKEEQVKQQLHTAWDAGIRVALCGTLGAVALAAQAGFEVHGDFGLNIMNAYALHTLEQLGVSRTVLSFEMTLSQVESLRGTLPRGMLAYGRQPLMLVRNCPVKAQTSCQECAGNGTITDRMGIVFPVRCRMGCSEILNSRPLYMADRYEECRHVDFLQLYFTTETAKECADIITAYRRKSPPKGEFTRGLFYRGVE